ncbi:CRAL-TRIO domain-containing protein [Sphaerosporella brunnea]|uniref:Phosphatidylinositol transfer protein SFH5 n=1 Tax=Sphaerosporella brunnea TaxID=1250544 RepID=A0A5J5F270_9PEZI|nr:CRAL-TRIO domain-containing protein [Sphaerosporella brunnea]
MAATASWPSLSAEHPIIQLFKKVPEVLTASAGYNELWGLTLAGPTTESSGDSVEQPTFSTALILQKFLRANANDQGKAFSQLKDTMVWRKSFFGTDGEVSKGWSDEKFKGLGYITVNKTKSGAIKVVCWNVYGATKDLKKTFGDLDEFLRWRVNLMEESLKRLNLGEATEPIPDYGKGADPYMGLQVHDYMNVSFLRLPGEVKTASKKTIEMFARYYPETLERKYFVNVPTLMSWVYTLLKKVLSAATLKKLEMLSSSKDLASRLGEDIPEAYGGKGQPLDASNSVQSPRDVDGENAAKQATDEAESKKAEEVPKTAEEAKPEESKAEETAMADETPKTEEAKPEDVKVEAHKEEVKAVAVVVAEAAPATEEVKLPETTDKTEEASKTVEPLPLTEEPTAAPVVESAATEPTSTVETPKDAPEAPKELSEVPLPAPTEVMERENEVVVV